MTNHLKSSKSTLIRFPTVRPVNLMKRTLFHQEKGVKQWRANQKTESKPVKTMLLQQKKGAKQGKGKEKRSLTSNKKKSASIIPEYAAAYLVAFP